MCRYFRNRQIWLSAGFVRVACQLFEGGDNGRAWDRGGGDHHGAEVAVLLAQCEDSYLLLLLLRRGKGRRNERVVADRRW